MSKYAVIITRPAEKDLETLDAQTIRRIRAKIVELAENPFPSGSKKLIKYQSSRISGETEQYYRVRVGDYRIIYAVKNELLLITIVKIANRKDAYR